MLYIYDFEQRLHSFGIYVVLYKEPWASAPLPGKVVVAEMAQGLMDGYGTEGASAYAQHYEIVEVITDILRLDVYGLNYFVLIEGQLSPLHASALFIHALCRSLICRCVCLKLLRGYAALDEAAHHIVEIHTKSHFLFKGLTSKALHKKYLHM